MLVIEQFVRQRGEDFELQALVIPRSRDDAVTVEHSEHGFQPVIVLLFGVQLLAQPVEPEGGRSFVIVGEQVVNAVIKVRVGIAPADEFHLRREVCFVVQQQAIGRETITAGAANLLIPGFHRAGNLGMDDEADVFLVDPHAERRRREHQRTTPLHELVLNAAAIVAVEVAVIADVRNAALSQHLAESFERADQREVHNPAAGGRRVPIMHRNDLCQFLVVAPDLFDGEPQVWTVDPFVK